MQQKENQYLIECLVFEGEIGGVLAVQNNIVSFIYLSP